MKSFLAEAGIDPAGYSLMDGSGLSAARSGDAVHGAQAAALHVRFARARNGSQSFPVARAGRHAQLAFWRYRRRRACVREHGTLVPRQRAFRLPAASGWHLGGVLQSWSITLVDAPLKFAV